MKRKKEKILREALYPQCQMSSWVWEPSSSAQQCAFWLKLWLSPGWHKSVREKDQRRSGKPAHISNKYSESNYVNPHLQYMLHSVFQNPCTPRPRRCSETQDLWQFSFTFQLFLQVESHNLVVDTLFVSVVTLINNQQSNVCKEP